MTRPLRVLHLEDSPRDAEIIRHRLDLEGLLCSILVANGRDSFEAALTAEPFDLILSDYNLPDYDGVTALKQAQAAQPGVPVILISGTLGEDEAVKCLHVGATDYLLKARLDRLAPAVRRALQEAETRRERKRVETALSESETRKAAILDSVLDCIVTIDAHGVVIEFNAAAARTFGYSKAEAIGRSLTDLIIPPRFRDKHTAGIAHYMATGEGPLIGNLVEITAMRADGTELPAELAITAITSGPVPIFTGVLRDITAHREADATSALLATIVESSDDAVIGSDLQGLVTSWNRGAETVFGFAASEMVGTPIMRLIPADREEEERQILAQISRGERLKHFETRRRTKDGRLIDVAITASPIRNAAGTVIGVSKVARDITERKRAEEIVRQAFDPAATRRGTWKTGGELAVLLVATAFMYVLAARFNWFDGVTRWVLERGYAELDETIFALIFLTIGLGVFSFRRWREAESQLTSRQQVQAALSLLHDEMDRRVKQRTQELDRANQALRTGITDRERTEEAGRTAAERMRFALEAAGVGIWDVDYTTGRVEWSEILESQYGLQPGTFGGTFEAFMERIHPDDRAYVLAAVGPAMRSGADFSLLNRALRPDGTVRWMSGAGRFLLGPDGAPTRGVGISQDITERRMLEEQFQQVQKMEAVGRLAAGVAHDFNNLLTVILGFCELLLADLDPGDPRQPDIAEIQKAGVRAAGLTRQLLTFSRKEIIQPALLDLNAIVVEMRVLLARLIGDDVEVVLGLGRALAAVRADRGQVEQIILNLAVNARDAMPRGGRLTIETANVDADDCPTNPQIPRRHMAPLRLAEDYGHRDGHDAGGTGPPVRAVFHHQGCRQGHRTWPRHGARHRHAKRRQRHRRERSRQGDVVHGVLPSGWCDGTRSR